VILATGGTGLVRAAYSSGKPAYGVGPGNVPAYIERTANVSKAVADVIAGKTFDYGTICSSEQAIVTEDSVRDQVLEECRKQGAHFLSPDEAKKLAAIVLDPVRHVPNNKIVGRPATMIAEMAGFAVPPETRVLIARLESNQVGRDFPLSAEKLSPILAFFSVADFAAAVDVCQRLLHFGGAGHTCSIHTQNPQAARDYGSAMPAFRVCVNTSAVHGSTGYSTNLFPAMTLGCGSPGGNITSDNITPMHLVNVKRIAWESRGVAHRTIAADQRLQPVAAAVVPAKAAAAAASAGGAPGSAGSGTPASPSPPSEPTRELIASVVQRTLAQIGIPRGAAIAAGPASAPPVPTPAEIAAQVVSRLFPAGSTAPTEAKGAEHSCACEHAAPAPEKPEKKDEPAAPAVTVVPFVSEAEVRVAIRKGEKIFVGPKSIVTPAARDLGLTHEVLVETPLSPSK